MVSLVNKDHLDQTDGQAALVPVGVLEPLDGRAERALRAREEIQDPRDPRDSREKEVQ